MFRHVVMFRWSPEATPDRREAAIEALRRLADDVAHLGRLSVGADAGIAQDNFDVAVVVDFDRREEYLAYVEHPRHRAVIADYLRPILAQRVAVQYELP